MHLYHWRQKALDIVCGLIDPPLRRATMALAIKKVDGTQGTP
jgi:hypothetical protein